MISYPNDIYVKENDAMGNGPEGIVRRYKKEFPVFDFFNSFVGSEYAKKYESYIRELNAEEAKKNWQDTLGRRKRGKVYIDFIYKMPRRVYGKDHYI